MQRVLSCTTACIPHPCKHSARIADRHFSGRLRLERKPAIGVSGHHPQIRHLGSYSLSPPTYTRCGHTSGVHGIGTVVDLHASARKDAYFFFFFHMPPCPPLRMSAACCCRNAFARFSARSGKAVCQGR